MPDKSPFRYDRAAGRYRGPTGAFVPESRVRAYLDSALEQAGKRMDTLANQLRSGEIDLISWEVRMRREVKIVATYSGAAAKGGWAQMTEGDYGRVGRYLQDQFKYLRGFMRDIASGKQPLNGMVNARTAMYAHSGRPLFHRMEKAEMRVRGNSQRRSVRSAFDSCAGCVEAEAAGWVDMDDASVPEIGERECRTRCKCSFEYRQPEETV